MKKVRMSWWGLAGVFLMGSMVLGGCSMNNVEDSGLKTDPSSTAYDPSFDLNADYESAVLDVIEASGVPAEWWNYEGGNIFSVEDFKSYVPTAGSYCGDSENDEELYTKSILIETQRTYSSEEYLRKSDQMWSHWESQGFKPYVVGSDGRSKKIAYRTAGNVLIQFHAGENGLAVFADTECLPSPSASASA